MSYLLIAKLLFELTQVMLFFVKVTLNLIRMLSSDLHMRENSFDPPTSNTTGLVLS